MSIQDMQKSLNNTLWYTVLVLKYHETGYVASEGIYHYMDSAKRHLKRAIADVPKSKR